MKSAYYAGSVKHMEEVLGRETSRFPHQASGGVNLFGFDVVLDGDLPEDIVEFRDGEGKVLGRLQIGTEGWIAMLKAASVVPTAPPVTLPVSEVDTQSIFLGEFDIGLPTPAEVAESLGEAFPRGQALMIAMHVYQPIRDTLRDLVLRRVGR